MDTLKPIPPEIKPCPYCKNIFMSLLRINGKFYKTCYDCRFKNKKQNQKHREKIKNKSNME